MLSGPDEPRSTFLAILKDCLDEHGVHHQVWTLRKPKDLPMPKKFEQTVQSAFNHHSAQSSVFKSGPEDDLFYSPGGKGSGYWAVHRDKAEAWLRRKALPSV